MLTWTRSFDQENGGTATPHRRFATAVMMFCRGCTGVPTSIRLPSGSLKPDCFSASFLSHFTSVLKIIRIIP